MPNFRDCRNPKWCVEVVVDLLLLFVTFYSNVHNVERCSMDGIDLKKKGSDRQCTVLLYA
jgi:hypothetical protein